VRPDPEALIEVLEPLQPRLYSISSSPRTNPGRVSLTVDVVRYEALGRERLGVASTFLGDRVDRAGEMLVYVQKAHNFALPKSGDTPIVMVGPGTGVAPFRAFLHERMATKTSGPAWLFFGHQREAQDYFYRDEWEMLRGCGVLTNLSLAWSRDGAQKTYVQHRIREAGAELWGWLERGAHFYVCGDAKRMARDVEAAICDVAAAHGGMGAEAAAAFVATLKRDGRYQADVY
jgi:sulfite reductase (NADPH) flavoprotein alpha-component